MYARRLSFCVAEAVILILFKHGLRKSTLVCLIIYSRITKISLIINDSCVDAHVHIVELIRETCCSRLVSKFYIFIYKKSKLATIA